MRGLWRKIKNRLLGRTWFFGFDPAYGPDRGAWVYGYRDRKGVFHIAHSDVLHTETSTRPSIYVSHKKGSTSDG